MEHAETIVLFIFLPPLLFNAAYFSSLRDLRRNPRPITLSAIALVLLTAVAVAAIAHAAIGGLPWAAAFALGAIVSPTDPLASGYIAYLPAERIGISGVLAAVTVGLIVGRRSTDLSTAASRLRGYAFWEVLVFLLNATLFALVGLQLPSILSEQEHSAAELAGLGLLVIATRLVWVFTVPYIVRALDRGPSQVARARAGA